MLSLIQLFDRNSSLSSCVSILPTSCISGEVTTCPKTPLLIPKIHPIYWWIISSKIACTTFPFIYPNPAVYIAPLLVEFPFYKITTLFWEHCRFYKVSPVYNPKITSSHDFSIISRFRIYYQCTPPMASIQASIFSQSFFFDVAILNIVIRTRFPYCERVLIYSYPSPPFYSCSLELFNVLTICLPLEPSVLLHLPKKTIPVISYCFRTVVIPPRLREQIQYTRFWASGSGLEANRSAVLFS